MCQMLSTSEGSVHHLYGKTLSSVCGKSNQSVPEADIRVKLQLQCKLCHCEVFYRSCEVTSRANELRELS